MFGIEDFSKPIVDFANFDIAQLGNALLFGFSILLIGMVTVFAVLCLLWLFLYLFRLFFHDIPAKKAAKKILSPVSAVVEKSETNTENAEEEIVAVIAAAIAMAESESSGMKFRVVSFRKV